MYLDHRMTARIAHILNMVDINALLLSGNGNVIIPEGDDRILNLPEDVRKNPTMPLVYGSVTLIGTNEEQPVFICLHGDSDEVKKCAILCAELINMVMREDMTHTDAERSLRLMLRNEVEASEFETLAAEHNIPLRMKRCVFYFYIRDMEAESAKPTLISSIGEENDMLAEVGRHSLVLMRGVDEEVDYSELEEYGRHVIEVFAAETGMEMLVGISEPHEDLMDIPLAYEEARKAVNVGRAYHPGKNVFVYRNQLLERFMNDVPTDMCGNYHSMIFNKKSARLFNEEMLHTIETFFDNSLNLSETARKLYIHRNTLVYRIEKVQKAIGLDLRNFDDAVTFKLMMLLGKNNGERRNRM